MAFVLVAQGPLDAAAVPTFRARMTALEDRLTDERRRYAPGAMRPFVLTFFGPADFPESPPRSDSEGVLASVQHAWATWRWTHRADARSGLDTSSYDSRIYIAARPPASDDRQMVEGQSEEGGRVGIVEVELDEGMADFALFVATHELFHTLGATDKYDALGRTLVPAGLAEPDRAPPFPQARAEVMARNRPVERGKEVPPENLDELGVGPVTAREIGWMRSGSALSGKSDRY